MGSVKKKPLAAMEKTQQTQEDTQPKKKGKESKALGEKKRPQVIAPKVNEQELVKLLTPLKAITIYGAARSLGVNASVAKSVLTTLESKGLLTKVGGFSGHYVWSLVS